MAQRKRKTPERWKPIPGYKGFYEVSDLGRVRSVDRWVKTSRGTGKKLVKQRIRKVYKNRLGYISLTLSKLGKKRTYFVHQLVLLAFFGPCPPGQEVCHEDGVPANNSWPENLRYDTRKGNHADKHRHGTALLGDQLPASVLKPKQVARLLRLYETEGYNYQQLGEMFNVHSVTVGKIVRGEQWKHIDAEGNVLPPEKYRKRSRVKKLLKTITYKNETRTIVEWSEYLDIPYGTLYWRLKKGLSTKEILGSTQKNGS